MVGGDEVLLLIQWLVLHFIEIINALSHFFGEVDCFVAARIEFHSFNGFIFFM